MRRSRHWGLDSLRNARSCPSPYLVVEDVAARLRCSIRTVHELTREKRIPHRKLPGSRRCLFRADELEAWEKGARLEVTELERGGRIVCPARPLNRDLDGPGERFL